MTFQCYFCYYYYFPDFLGKPFTSIGTGVRRQERYEMLEMKMKFVISFCKLVVSSYMNAFDLNRLLKVLKL